MSGPWEKYAVQEATGPWAKYQAAADTDSDPGATSNRSVGEEFKRQVGLTGRAAASGVGSLLSMVGDPLNATINKVAGTQLPPVSRGIEATLDKIFPKPENAIERVAQDVAGSMAGGAGTIKAASAVASQAASPLMQTIAKLMGQGPGMQIASAGTAGAGAGVAREADMGVGGQIAGAVVGGLSPAVAAGTVRTAQRAARPITAAISNRTAEQVAAERLANMSTQAKPGSAMPLKDVLALRIDQLMSDAEIVPGSMPTTAQLTGDSRMLMAERARRSNDPDFGAQFADRAAEQHAAQDAALNSVSPVTRGVNEAAQDAGTVIRQAYDTELESARKAVNEAFAPLEASTEPTMTLPREAVQDVINKFLGEGSRGPRGDLARILGDIENLPNANLPKDDIRSIISRHVASLDGPQLLAPNGQPLRPQASDDIVNLLGDIQRLPEKAKPEQIQRIKESIGSMMEEAAAAKDTTKTALLNDVLNAIRGRPQPVPFKTLQNLKSSAGEYATEAAKNEQMTAAKAAGDVRALLDDVPETASTFTPEQAKQYRLANDLRAQMADRLETGPALDMMRQGGDNAAKLQGGEIPRAFFNNRATSRQDIEQFMKAVGSRETAVDALRNYAVTGLNDFATNTSSGQFTPSKFGTWMQTHEPALGTLFDKSHLDKLRAIASDLDRASKSNTVGKAPGSDTAMNLAQAGAMDRLVSKIPGGSLIVGLVGKVSDQQIGQIVNRAMMDPQFASALLERVGPANRGVLARQLAQGMEVAAVGNAVASSNNEPAAPGQASFSDYMTAAKARVNAAPPASAPTAPTTGDSKDVLLQQARDAIAKGAPRDKVFERLRSMGVDPDAPG